MPADAMIRRPAMPLYVSDFVDSESVALMPLEAVGVYIKLLCYNWKNGSIPADLDQLATMLRLNARTLRRIWPHVAPKFGLKDRSDPSRLTNERVEKELKRADEKSEKSRNAAQLRHVDHANAGAFAMPRGRASSVSAASSSPEEIPPGEPDKPAPPAQQNLLSTVLAPPKPSKTKPDGRDVADVIQRFCTRWVEVHRPDDGRPPKLDQADRGQLVALVRAHGRDKALSYVERYLADADPWLFEKCHPAAQIARHVDRYRATTAPPPQRSRFAPPSPTRTTREQRAYSTPVEEVLREYENIDVAPPPPEFHEMTAQLGRRTGLGIG